MDKRIACVECDKMFECETDLWLCEKCVSKFDLDRLWDEHDNGKIDALRFNESERMREQYRLEV